MFSFTRILGEGNGFKPRKESLIQEFQIMRWKSLSQEGFQDSQITKRQLHVFLRSHNLHPECLQKETGVLRVSFPITVRTKPPKLLEP